MVAAPLKMTDHESPRAGAGETAHQQARNARVAGRRGRSVMSSILSLHHRGDSSSRATNTVRLGTHDENPDERLAEEQVAVIFDVGALPQLGQPVGKEPRFLLLQQT